MDPKPPTTRKNGRRSRKIPESRKLALRNPGRERPGTTEECIDAILSTIVEAGVSYTTACDLWLVSREEWSEWCKSPSLGLNARLRQAKAESTVRRVKHVQSKGGPMAQQWLLERQMRDEYGDAKTVDLQHSGSVGIKLDSTMLDALAKDVSEFVGGGQ